VLAPTGAVPERFQEAGRWNGEQFDVEQRHIIQT
jgi:hypothetical protein